MYQTSWHWFLEVPGQLLGVSDSQTSRNANTAFIYSLFFIENNSWQADNSLKMLKLIFYEK